MLTTSSGIFSVPALSGELEALADRAKQSVVLVQAGRGRGGSGVIWSEDGLIISNAHVVTGEEAQVTLPTGEARRARVIAKAKAHDLVALQTEGARGLRPARVGSSAGLRVGEIVAAVGNPLGMRNAVTVGVVSGVPARGAESYGGVLRLSLTLRPGNSGGALLNAAGEVVGIPHMVVGGGMALAVPSDAVGQLLRGELGVRGRLGVGVRWAQLTSSQAAALGLAHHNGLLVTEVTPGSPAAQAGLGLGDLVVGLSAPGVEGPLSSAEPILRGMLPAGRPVWLAVLRAGVLRRVELTPAP